MNTKKIFVKPTEKCTRSQNHNESEFSFLSISPMSCLHRPKELVNQWFVEFEKEQSLQESQRLYKYLRSTENKEHWSGLGELWFYHQLKIEGYEVNCHPSFPNKERSIEVKPDFLVSRGGTPCFYLEVVTVIGTKEYQQREQFENLLLHEIKKINSPSFTIATTSIKGKPKGSFPITSIIKQIEQKLKWIITTTDQKKFNLAIKESGWAIDVLFIRRNNQESSPTLGPTSTGVQNVDLRSNIRKRIKQKGEKYNPYKQTDLPFILAINVISEHWCLNHHSITDSLLGDIEYLLFPKTKLIIPQRRRKGAGFVTGRGKKHTLFSAVWFSANVQVSQLENIEQSIWLHPGAKNPLESKILQAPHYICDENSDPPYKEWEG